MFYVTSVFYAYEVFPDTFLKAYLGFENIPTQFLTAFWKIPADLPEKALFPLFCSQSISAAQ